MARDSWGLKTNLQNLQIISFPIDGNMKLNKLKRSPMGNRCKYDSTSESTILFLIDLINWLVGNSIFYSLLRLSRDGFLALSCSIGD